MLDVAQLARLLGNANAFKHGDAAQGLAAADERERAEARAALAALTIRHVHERPVHEDDVQRLAWSTVDADAYARVADWTFGALKTFLLASPEADIKDVARGLCSDAIGAVVKLCSDAELTAISREVFHALPGSNLGARGYLGARIQPNSPTDHPDDIFWQVLCGWSYATGDVVLGTNPVDGTAESVARIERTLKDLLDTFGLEDVLPHCVLAHVDTQAEVERRHPGTTGIWFQSLAGCDTANRTFDISTDKMMRHAATRTGKYGLYLETGQGADFTNGHGHGFDMVLHEARKYGFARALLRRISEVQTDGGGPWLHVNDVAGFIGPEVFENKDQLVRCCLEDLVMGKLHGLTIGLDVCSTLHMKVSLDDLDECLDRILPANPAYLMALPTKNDPMLSYLTTSFQDHVRLRRKFGYRVDDRMAAFFRRLGVIDEPGEPTDRFGDPLHVFVQYRRAKGDARPEAELRGEGERAIAEAEARGVPIARGHGEHPWDLAPHLDRRLRALYHDAKESLYAELDPSFAGAVPHAIELCTNTAGRDDYVRRPTAGESLSPESTATVERLRDARPAHPDVQLVISDGLNARAITDEGHVLPFLDALRAALASAGRAVAPETLIVHGGRVRAGYRIGELFFGRAADEARRTIVHVIGERPGSGHHAFSVYVTTAPTYVWAKSGRVDHDATRVVSGVADTALLPEDAARGVAEMVG